MGNAQLCSLCMLGYNSAGIYYCLALLILISEVLNEAGLALIKLCTQKIHRSYLFSCVNDNADGDIHVQSMLHMNVATQGLPITKGLFGHVFNIYIPMVVAFLMDVWSTISYTLSGQNFDISISLFFHFLDVSGCFSFLWLLSIWSGSWSSFITHRPLVHVTVMCN